MYQNLHSAVRINGNYTSWFRQIIGVRQGDILSPTLFSLFINDLVDCVKDVDGGTYVGDTEVRILLYADDIVIIAEDEEKLQGMLDKVDSWCRTWRLSINNTKTEVIHFRKEHDPQTDFDFKFGDAEIEKVASYKYLGLDLTYSMNFTHTVEVLAKAASRSLGQLAHKYYTNDGLSFDTYTALYNAYVIPIMNYGAGVWGGPKYPKCDTVQHRAMRTFLGVNKPAPICFMYGDMDWIPPQHLQKCEAIKLWCRFCNLPDNRLTKRVFMNDNTRWMTNIKTLLINSGQSQVWTDRFTSSPHSAPVVEKVQIYLKNEFTKTWTKDKVATSKLCYYNNMKSEIKCEDYVKCNKSSRQARATVAKLRSSTYPLAVELGRYRGIAKESRVCKHCATGQVEDEVHYFINCSHFTNQRAILYNNISYIINDFLDFSDEAKLNVILSDNRLINYVFIYVLSCQKSR